jgi:SET domain-containing protein
MSFSFIAYCGFTGLLFVDASQRANVGSSCSHSCNSNCTSAVVARNGKLVIALTTVRHIVPLNQFSMHNT